MAWRAAENAFFRAEASPRGLYSPALSATMTNPELLLVKKNLAGDEQEGFIGRGGWSLGSPSVVSLGPSHSQPTTAVVKSCIDGMQILVNEKTGKPASGVGGQTDWIGETSTMLRIGGAWKLSKQSAVANQDKAVACAGIAG